MHDNRLEDPALIAGAISGMITISLHPVAGRGVLRDVVAWEARLELWRVVAANNYMLNQAFAQIFVVASSVAIVRLPSGFCGLLVSIAVISCLPTGRLTLDVDGFGLIPFSQAIWLIAAGVFLFREKEISPLETISSANRRDPSTGRPAERESY